MSADDHQALVEIRLRREIFKQLGTSGNRLQEFEQLHDALVQTRRDRRRVAEMIDVQFRKLRLADDELHFNDKRAAERKESTQKNIRDLMSQASVLDGDRNELEQKIERLYEIANDEEARRFAEIDEQGLRDEARASLEVKLNTFEAQATHEQRSLLPGASPSINIRAFEQLIFCLGKAYAEAAQFPDAREMDFFMPFLTDPVAPILRRLILLVVASQLAGEKTFKQAIGDLLPRIEPFLTDDAFAQAIVSIYWHAQASRESRRAYRRIVDFIDRDRSSAGFKRARPIFIEAVENVGEFAEALEIDSFKYAGPLTSFFGDMFAPVAKWLRFYLDTHSAAV